MQKVKAVKDKVEEICSKFPVFGPLLGRTWHEIAFFAMNAFALFWAKGFIENPALQLFMYKMLLINAGLIHASFTRKLSFPYIDFETETDGWKKALIVALYIILPFCYAHGG